MVVQWVLPRRSNPRSICCKYGRELDVPVVVTGFNTTPFSFIGTVLAALDTPRAGGGRRFPRRPVAPSNPSNWCVQCHGLCMTRLLVESGAGGRKARGRVGGREAPPPPCVTFRRVVFTGPWTVTRSSLRMLRWVAAFCRPLRPVLLLVSFPRSPPQGCITRDRASDAAPEAGRQAVGGGCQSGWGLLSVTKAIEAGTCREGDNGWAQAGHLAGGGGVPLPMHRCTSPPPVLKQTHADLPDLFRDGKEHPHRPFMGLMLAKAASVARH